MKQPVAAFEPSPSTKHRSIKQFWRIQDDVIKWKLFPRYWTHREGNPPVTGGFPSERPVMPSFGAFFDLRLNKRLSKQSRRQWFGTPSRSLWRHCNAFAHNPWVLPIIYFLLAGNYLWWWEDDWDRNVYTKRQNEAPISINKGCTCIFFSQNWL